MATMHIMNAMTGVARWKHQDFASDDEHLEPIRKPHLIVGRLKSHGRFVVLHRRIIEIRLLRTPCVTRDSLALGIESRFPDRLLIQETVAYTMAALLEPTR